MSESIQEIGTRESTLQPNDGRTSARRAWLLAVLQRRPDLLARLAYFQAQLRRLPRAQRRWFQRRVAMPLSAVALMLALSGAPMGLLALPGATINVIDGKVAIANDGLCSLIEAINNANAAGGQPHADCVAGSGTGADTLMLPTGGTFNVTTYNNYGGYGYNGLPEITTAIVIEGHGSTVARTGDDEYRLFNVTPTGDLTLKDVTVTGGNSGTYYYGGAIRVEGGKLALVDSTITGNSAAGGGAIYSDYGTVTVTRSKLNDNTGYAGSAIHAVYTELTIADSELNDNKGPNGFGGGAIYSQGDDYANTPSGNVTITNTTISGNFNDGGGALMITFGTLILTDSTVTDNTTKEGYGAGVYLNGSAATITGTTITGNTTTKYSGAGVAIFGGQVTITDSLIDDNKSGYMGGGVYTLDAELTINQTTISNNSAKDKGGGVTVYSGELTLENTTVSGSSADSGGGIYNRGTTLIVNSTISQNTADNGGGVANKGTLELVNATVTGNEATTGVGGGVVNSDGDDDLVGVLSLSRTLIAGNIANGAGPQVHSSGATATTTANQFNLFGSSGVAGVVGFTPGATDIVPSVAVTAVLENALAANGGPTRTHALTTDSPALDAAPSGPCEIAPADGRDQRGAARNQDADGQSSPNECDIGAYELGDDTTINYKLFLPAAVWP